MDTAQSPTMLVNARRERAALLGLSPPNEKPANC
jgi:hypothetical protein